MTATPPSRCQMIAATLHQQKLTLPALLLIVTALVIVGCCMCPRTSGSPHLGGSGRGSTNAGHGHGHRLDQGRENLRPASTESQLGTGRPVAPVTGFADPPKPSRHGHGNTLCRLPPGLRLGLWNPQPWHSEVFGTVIAYAAACGHNLTIHSPLDPVSSLPYYIRLYGPAMHNQDASLQQGASVHNGHMVHHETSAGSFEAVQHTYDAVIVTTPNWASGLGVRSHCLNAHRYVYFVHALPPHTAIDDELLDTMRLRLYMNPLIDGLPWALPVYPRPEDIADTVPEDTGTGPVDDTSHLARQATPRQARPLPSKTIVVIGMTWDGDDAAVTAQVNELAAGLLEGGWTVVSFHRDHPMPPSTTDASGHSHGGHGGHGPPPSNLHVRVGASTEGMIEAVQTATFVAILPSNNSEYVRVRMTGSLPLAISQGTPILTTEPFAGVYSLGPGTGSMVVRSIPEALPQLLALKWPEYAQYRSGAESFRGRAWAHAVQSLEWLLAQVLAVHDALVEQHGGPDAAYYMMMQLGLPSLPMSAHFPACDNFNSTR